MLYLPTWPRLMLLLEWMLLAMTVVTGIVIALIDLSPHFPVFGIVCIAVLALMGIKLPQNNHLLKIGYTLAEFALVWLPNLWGDHILTSPILGLVIVIRSAQMFKLPGRIGVTGSVYLSFLLALIVLDRPLGIPFSQVIGEIGLTQVIQNNPTNLLILKLNGALYYGMMLTFILLLVNTLLSERQSRETLSDTLAQLRQYSLRIENQAALQERNRIAREIHDALGHTLTAQSVQLEGGLLLLKTAKTKQAHSFFMTAKSLCAQALDEVRQSVAMLRSDCLSGKPLEDAIATLIHNFQTTTAIAPCWTVDLSQPIPTEANSAIYRIVQEALTNITRHAQATVVTLQLTTHHQTLYLVIKDDGQGFNPAQNSTGFGLQGMQERALALDGLFSLFSATGSGCLITVQIPLPGPVS